ncbi:MAG TPA: glycosyl hydrolase [Verrucomicrobiae bacterium]|nr:glycosyl hydrolase [Verrucomicrobiae bacterium]
MKQFRIATAPLAALAAAVSAQATGPGTDVLWDSFRNPPPEARASCYWWWKGGLTAAEMGRQIRVLKEAGLGGAHIIPWRSDPAYLSPEWLVLLRAAADAARRETMFLDLSANATWPFRGDWVPLEQSLHKVNLEIHHIDGPAKFALPGPTGGKAARGGRRNAEKKVVSRILLAQLAPEPIDEIEEARDVTAAVAGDGSPGVDVPAGRHILYIVRLSAGVKSQPEFGRVPDHFDPRAIENYLKGFADRVSPALGGRLDNGLRAMYCDSIEISEANWTPNLPEEFERRCGYDLMPYLPLVLDMPGGRKAPPTAAARPLDETIARVRYDYCRTLTDLFLDGLAHPFYRWCHENRVLCRWQAYGSPWFYGIEDGYRIPDIPEGNNWLFSRPAAGRDPDVHGWPVWQKYTSSGAHQAGRRIASTEAATVVEGMFQETLDMLKRADDFNFVCGINHSFLHGFCYSPANEPFPGRSQYGTYFSEHNPWWPYMRRWMDYNARLSAVFQSSRPVAQVALLFRTSDVWGRAGLDRNPFQLDPPWAHQVWRWINQCGANADYVSDQVLQQATYSDGKISFGPMRYDALVVLGARTLIPATADALDRYARAGGRIVFAGGVPERSPGMQDAPANDRKIRGIVQNLLREHPANVFARNAPGRSLGADGEVSWVNLMNQWRSSTSTEQCLAWADRLLADLRISRSVQYENPRAGLYQIHYRHEDGRELYFFVNTTTSDVTAHAALPSGLRRVERWDPESGCRSEFPADGRGRVLVLLPPAGSLLLVTGEGSAWRGPSPQMPVEPIVIQHIAGPWSASFDPANGDAFEVAPFELTDLHQIKEERLNRFAGEAVYRARFAWDKSEDDSLLLDLGDAPKCLTEASINGVPLGVRWYGRHEYSLRSALKHGENQLEVKAVTTLFNCLRGPSEPPLPSGLMGPVTLKARRPTIITP